MAMCLVDPLLARGQWEELPLCRAPAKENGFVHGHRSRAQLGVCSGLWTSGRDSWWTLESGKVEISVGRWVHCSQPSLLLIFLSKAANLTTIIDEKEQNLREKTEVLLQKEQEILQLEQGEESVPGRAFSPFQAQHPAL